MALGGLDQHPPRRAARLAEVRGVGRLRETQRRILHGVARAGRFHLEHAHGRPLGAQLDAVARAQHPGRLQALVVDVGAVGRFQVAQHRGAGR